MQLLAQLLAIALRIVLVDLELDQRLQVAIERRAQQAQELWRGGDDQVLEAAFLMRLEQIGSNIARELFRLQLFRCVRRLVSLVWRAHICIVRLPTPWVPPMLWLLLPAAVLPILSVSLSVSATRKRAAALTMSSSSAKGFAGLVSEKNRARPALAAMIQVVSISPPINKINRNGDNRKTSIVTIDDAWRTGVG